MEITPEQQKEELLRQRKATYLQACAHPVIQEFLADLSKFAGMGQPPAVSDKLGKIDVERTMIMIGRQEMFLRIQHHLNLSVPQLFALYTGKSFRVGDTDVA